MRARAVWFVIVLLLVLTGASAWLAQPSYFGAHPVNGGTVVVRIPPGAGAREAARLLEQAGVVRSALAVRWLAAWSGTTRSLKAGEYRFAGSMTPGAVIDMLVGGESIVHEVTIPEGLTLAQTNVLLEGAGLEIAGSLAALMRGVEGIADIDSEALDLEGYLFPDTYHFPRGVSADVVVREMVARFREVTAGLRRDLGEPTGSVREWVTLASLVEKETGRSDERAAVAAVFRNRLDRGMLLQCDPTVIYALQTAGIDPGDSLASRLAFDHPYNTYRYPDLPPGPIANPGAAALRGALRPASSDNLYFVADGEGGHNFSATLQEHNRAVRALRRQTRTAGQP